MAQVTGQARRDSQILRIVAAAPTGASDRQRLTHIIGCFCGPVVAAGGVLQARKLSRRRRVAPRGSPPVDVAHIDRSQRRQARVRGQAICCYMSRKPDV